MDRGLVFEPTSGPVARTLIGAGTYLMAADMQDRSTWYEWKSGVVAPVYTDCRVLARDPGATGIVLSALATATRAYYPNAEQVVGMAEAGIIWSSLVARELGAPHGFVRKQRKEHGTSALVECSLAPGRRAVVVDDLMASGRSMESALEALATECQTEVIGVMTIVNWNLPEMRERFARIDVPYHSLVSYPQLLRAALEAKHLDKATALELGRFYRNPKAHEWKLRSSDARRTA